MKKVFIESHGFTDKVQELLDDDNYALFQKQLLGQPEQGTVMPGCGGLRKVRVRDPKRRKGKRGGARVIYLHVPEANWIYLLDIYGKGEKDDLNVAERKLLRQLAAEFKREALQAAARARKGDTI